MAVKMNNFVIAVTICAALINKAHADNLCLKTGTQCSTNCEDIILCPTKYGEFIKVLTCDSKNMCGTNDQGRPSCDAKTCELKIFLCTTSGTVPDPESASAYYTCPGIDTRGTQRQCEEATFFNTTTLRCSKDTTPYKPVACNEPGAMGIIDMAKRFCYICDSLSKPLVYPCDLDNPSQIKL